MKLLLAEDEAALNEALVEILKHNGYTVDAVFDGRDALEYALAADYDGIILDIMMPKMEGTEVLKTLREKGIATPVLFLTAKGEIEDRIEGLDLGADDYITKPFDMGELLARVRAMVRRKENYTQADLACGNLALSRSAFTLSVPGEAPLSLSGKEFQMIELLMTHPGQLYSVDSFLDHIWPDGEAGEDTVWVYISNLRKKLKSLHASCEIKSTRGVGYSIVDTGK
ncbi:MAG: response regulator transcription factor [Lachnospiraceae bacterium]|nr:response regulator transcription factor [Lachnospiraceae bacterium]